MEHQCDNPCHSPVDLLFGSSLHQGDHPGRTGYHRQCEVDSDARHGGVWENGEQPGTQGTALAASALLLQPEWIRFTIRHEQWLGYGFPQDLRLY